MWIDPPATISAPEPTEPTMMRSPSRKTRVWPDRTEPFTSIIGGQVGTWSEMHGLASSVGRGVPSLDTRLTSSAFVSRLSPAGSSPGPQPAFERYRRFFALGRPMTDPPLGKSRFIALTKGNQVSEAAAERTVAGDECAPGRYPL